MKNRIVSLMIFSKSGEWNTCLFRLNIIFSNLSLYTFNVRLLRPRIRWVSSWQGGGWRRRLLDGGSRGQLCPPLFLLSSIPQSAAMDNRWTIGESAGSQYLGMTGMRGNRREEEYGRLGGVLSGLEPTASPQAARQSEAQSVGCAAGT